VVRSFAWRYLSKKFSSLSSKPMDAQPIRTPGRPGRENWVIATEPKSVRPSLVQMQLERHARLAERRRKHLAIFHRHRSVGHRVHQKRRRRFLRHLLLI